MVKVSKTKNFEKNVILSRRFLTLEAKLLYCIVYCVYLVGSVGVWVGEVSLLAGVAREISSTAGNLLENKSEPCHRLPCNR